MLNYMVNLDADPPVIHVLPADERCNVDAVPRSKRGDVQSARALTLLVREGYHLCSYCFGSVGFSDTPKEQHPLENPSNRG